MAAGDLRSLVVRTADRQDDLRSVHGEGGRWRYHVVDGEATSCDRRQSNVCLHGVWVARR